MSITKIFTFPSSQSSQTELPHPPTQRTLSSSLDSLYEVFDFLHVSDDLHLLSGSYSKDKLEQILQTANTATKIKAKASVIGDHAKTLATLNTTCITIANPTENDIRAFTQFSQLTQVNLSGSFQLMNYDLFVLAKTKTITHLNLSNCELITDSAFDHLAAMGTLKELNISGMIHVSGIGFKKLAKLDKLEVLKACSLRRLEDEDLAPILALPKLRSLAIEGCEKLSKEKVKTLQVSSKILSIHF
jgi:hypothetical protein